jgi:hypothetical protein
MQLLEQPTLVAYPKGHHEMIGAFLSEHFSAYPLCPNCRNNMALMKGQIDQDTGFVRRTADWACINRDCRTWVEQRDGNFYLVVFAVTGIFAVNGVPTNDHSLYVCQRCGGTPPTCCSCVTPLLHPDSPLRPRVVQ